mgnify:CR=1 FL=1
MGGTLSATSAAAERCSVCLPTVEVEAQQAERDFLRRNDASLSGILLGKRSCDICDGFGFSAEEPGYKF